MRFGRIVALDTVAGSPRPMWRMRRWIRHRPRDGAWWTSTPSIPGWIKHQVLGDRFFETLADLRAAVEHCFHQRVAKAKDRRNKVWAKALATAAQS